MNNQTPENEPEKKLTRKEERAKLRQEAMDQVFGTNRGEYMGNIWGWKFSMLSLVGLLLIGGLAIYGVTTGKIDMEQYMKRPSDELQEQRDNVMSNPQDSVKKLD